MAGTKISELPVATTLTGAELVPVVQSGATKQSTVALAAASSLSTYTPAGTGAVTTTVQTKLRETVSVFDFMTATEIAAVQSYSFSTDVTSACQTALDAAWALKADLFAPAGGYLVTGLTLPGNFNVVDERDQALRFYGAGYGTPFSTVNGGGTVFKSVTDAPVLKDNAVTAPNAQGTFEIDHMRFDGTSNSHPVILLNSFYGNSSIHNLSIYQRGDGDGLKILYGATGYIYENYVVNADFATYGIGAARTGVGFNLPNSYGSGLVTLRKNTARGFKDGYIIGGGGGVPYSFKITECECSVVYNGITLAADTNKAVLSDNYFEGGDGGVGIINLGNFNTIEGNLIFSGFAKGIEDTSTTNVGSLIQGNIINVGSTVNGICIDILSSAAFGGNNKNVVNNTIIYTAGTNGVNGIKISGTQPRINCTGNAFVPRSVWTGTNTTKINDTSTGGITGLLTGQTGNKETAFLSGGAIALEQSNSALTEANVTSLNLTVPEGVSYFTCAATVPTSVFRFTAGQTSGRLVTFRTTNANMTFSDGAYNQLAGGVSFTGPGTITFLIDQIGGSSYGWEVSRTVF